MGAYIFLSGCGIHASATPSFVRVWQKLLWAGEASFVYPEEREMKARRDQKESKKRSSGGPGSGCWADQFSAFEGRLVAMPEDVPNQTLSLFSLAVQHQRETDFTEKEHFIL